MLPRRPRPLPRPLALALTAAAALAWMATRAPDRTAHADAPPDPAPTRASARPDPPEDAPEMNVANYTIAARLDRAHRVIDGRATVRWVNTSGQPATELWWHLYMNGFENPRTLFFRTLGAAGHRGHEPGAFGRIEVRELRIAGDGGADLLPTATNDPAVEADRSQLRTPLPVPVPPGGELTLEVAFRTVLPAAFARTGYAGEFVFAGQWFPKLAVLERDGRWAHFAFHSNSEFYADFGRYDVTLTVPRGDVVGACGAQVGPVVPSADGGEAHHYVATRVHDFAWTAWAHFREREDRLGALRVRTLFPPGEDRVARRAVDAIAGAAPVFARRFGGAYPYPNLTVVIPPRAAAGVEGMEYPTLITTSGLWFSPAWAHDAEWIAIHEFAHQYFYGVIASNEARWPFLDEGFAEYATGVAMEQIYGAGNDAAAGLGLHLSFFAMHGARAGASPSRPPVASPAAAFPSFNAYGELVYARGATILRTLEGVAGRGPTARALDRYAAAQRFRHPTLDDLLDAVRAEAGDAAVDGYLRPALLGDPSLDYRVGWLDAHSAYVERRGALALPVAIELVRRDGTRTRARWDGAGSSFRARDAPASAPVVSARVDPEGALPLDRERVNDALSAAPRTGWPVPLGARLGFWIAALLRAVGP